MNPQRGLLILAVVACSIIPWAHRLKNGIAPNPITSADPASVINTRLIAHPGACGWNVAWASGP